MYFIHFGCETNHTTNDSTLHIWTRQCNRCQILSCVFVPFHQNQGQEIVFSIHISIGYQTYINSFTVSPLHSRLAVTIAIDYGRKGHLCTQWVNQPQRCLAYSVGATITNNQIKFTTLQHIYCRWLFWTEFSLCAADFNSPWLCTQGPLVHTMN